MRRRLWSLFNRFRISQGRCEGVSRIFHWEARPEGQRPRSGGVLGEGQQPPPYHAAIGGLGSAVNSPAWFGAEPRPPKGFPLLPALRMASHDTNTHMYSIVNYGLSRSLLGDKIPMPQGRRSVLKSERVRVTQVKPSN